MPRKLTCYYIALRLFILFFLLFSFTWRSLKSNSRCFACCTSSCVRAQCPQSPQQGSCSLGVLGAQGTGVCPAQLCPQSLPGSLCFTPVSSAAKTSPCSFILEVFLTNGVSAFLLNLFLLQSAGAFCHFNELSLSLFFLSIP